MEVKGTGIKTTRDFVKSQFPDQYDSWIESLPEKSRALYVSPMLNLAGWYPIKEAYLTPMDMITKVLYDNDEKKAGEAMGSFSAEEALNGIYKLYMMVATPKYLMQRASVIFSTYYLPCDIKVEEAGHKSVVMCISKFTSMSALLEYRIGGWCVRALEMCRCKAPFYKIHRSMLKGDTVTEYYFHWE
jgi:hypothetical protein